MWPAGSILSLSLFIYAYINNQRGEKGEEKKKKNDPIGLEEAQARIVARNSGLCPSVYLSVRWFVR